jgi:hypothetical protein
MPAVVTLAAQHKDVTILSHADTHDGFAHSVHAFGLHAGVEHPDDAPGGITDGGVGGNVPGVHHESHPAVGLPT